MIEEHNPTAEHTPAPHELEWAAFERQWVDPVRPDSDLVTFHTYRQPSRRTAPGAEGSYLLYLPPHYDTDPERRFPVVYWLHGGRESSCSALGVVERIDEAIRARQMPPVILVSVQALPIGWYLDSKDGERPIERTVIDDLIPHVDATYRTIADRSGRTIEGFSMGGYGTFRFGLKYPGLFGRISGIAPAILRTIGEEPAQRTKRTFFDDADYYRAVSPWTLLMANAPELRHRGTRIRILAGAEDHRLRRTILDFRDQIEQAGLAVEYAEVPAVAHDHLRIIDGVGEAYPAFWATP
ncbi:MAG: alpha/beta hydrolase-fold protein [Nocardioides sp.]|uniref:alpha/beta hydrolase n=1 Tax=Nocardioides sp. TaxID=35761 RepID=UPI0039E54F67